VKAACTRTLGTLARILSYEPKYCYRHPDRETGLSCSVCERPICYECMTPAPVGLRCPEHSGKPQGVQRVTAAATRATTRGIRRMNAVTMALIGLNVLVYAAELAMGGNLSSGTGNTIYDHGALIANAVYADGSPAGVANGEWWRLITSAFLHYGPLHLGMNMFSLYFVGSILEQVIGRWRFVLLYVVSGLSGAAGALLVTPNSPTVGASGAIFGVLGALLILERRGHIATGGQVLGLIVLNLVFTFAVPGISIGGHVGGLIAGVVLMFAFVRFLRSWQLSLAAAAVVAAAAIIVAYSSV
jgi:membrane associated rhomboid family serine protease